MKNLLVMEKHYGLKYLDCENTMFAVGHLALGYLSGKMTSKILDVDVKIHLLFVLSVLPDIDLIVPGIMHRGPTHSIIFMAVLSFPLLLIYKKTVITYLIAMTQHTLIGDFLAGGGTQLFWPLSSKWLGIEVCQLSTLNIMIEWIFFAISLITMLKLGDLRNLLEPHFLNLILIAPLSSICSPLFLGFPVRAPIALYIPHLVYLAVFALSLINDLRELTKKAKKRKTL